MGQTRVDCPFDTDEVWGVNTSYRQIDGTGGHKGMPGGFLSKIFICHRGQEYDWQGDRIFFWDELGGQVKKGVEIVALFDIKELNERNIPFTRIYYKTLAKKFDTDYFADTIAYQIAYALHINTTKDRKTGLLKLKEPMRIRMYGVDMFDSDGYATERGGVEYFIAIAKTIGVDFWVHPDSRVCKTENHQPYGFAKSIIKAVDYANVIELQKTKKGIRKLVKMGILDSVNADKMLLELDGYTVDLRLATDEDTQLMFEWRNNPEVYKGFYTQKAPLTKEEHQKWWKSRNKDWRTFIITCQERPIGVVTIGQLDHWSPEIGYYIGDTSMWGKGLGTQVVWQAIRWLSQYGKKYCHTTVLKNNFRSLSILYKLGFNILGEAREGEVWLQLSLK